MTTFWEVSRQDRCSRVPARARCARLARMTLSLRLCLKPLPVRRRNSTAPWSTEG